MLFQNYLLPFYIHLIPETLEITNLNKLNEDDLVNIEIDQNTITVVNTVRKTLAAQNLDNTAILMATPFAT